MRAAGRVVLGGKGRAPGNGCGDGVGAYVPVGDDRVRLCAGGRFCGWALVVGAALVAGGGFSVRELFG